MLEVLAREFQSKKRRYPNYLGSTTILGDSDLSRIRQEELSETNAAVWTIIFSIEYSSDGLTTDATF